MSACASLRDPSRNFAKFWPDRNRATAKSFLAEIPRLRARYCVCLRQNSDENRIRETSARWQVEDWPKASYRSEHRDHSNRLAAIRGYCALIRARLSRDNPDRHREL